MSTIESRASGKSAVKEEGEGSSDRKQSKSLHWFSGHSVFVLISRVMHSFVRWAENQKIKTPALYHSLTTKLTFFILFRLTQQRNNCVEIVHDYFMVEGRCGRTPYALFSVIGIATLLGFPVEKSGKQGKLLSNLPQKFYSDNDCLSSRPLLVSSKRTINFQ